MNAISSLIDLNLQGNQQTEATQGSVNGFSIQQNHFNNNPITRLS